MKNNLNETFDRLFKFNINDDVRHKGDTKGHIADMGLLVIERHLIESEDNDANRIYERAYVCRMIRFSGSGDLARFNEKELMSVQEHELQKLAREKEMNEMRTEGRMVEKEIMEIFGISKEDYLYEVIDGKPDTSKKFRMSGFESSEDGVILSVTESLFTAAGRKEDGSKIKREDRKWTSKSQFVKVA